MVKNNKLTFDLTGKLSKRDELILTKLTMTEQTVYLLSKLGFKPQDRELQYKVNAEKQKLTDKTTTKRLVREDKNHFLDLLRSRFTVGFKKPNDSAQYYGIEIECFIPFKAMNMNKYDYEGSSTSECSTCEGSGNITCTHRDSGHETEIECPDCEGSGERENDECENDECENDTDQAISDAKSFFKKKVQELQIKGLDVKHDGSLDSEGDDDVLPVELTMLIRQDNLSDLEKLCALLNDLGAFVNNSCGFHVHIDSRHKTRSQIATIAKRFEASMPFMSQLVPKSRRDNSYCKLGVSSLTGGRYFAVNLTSFEKHGTVEVRLHSATTNFVKIKNWLKIVSAIYSNKKAKALNDWQDFYAFIKADDDLIQYMKSRVALFNPEKRVEESDCENEPNCHAS